MKMGDVITRVHGTAISTEHVIRLLKFNGAFRNTVLQLIEIEVIRLKAQAYGIEVKEKELDAFVQERRRLMGISDDLAAEQHLRQNGIRMDQWRYFLSIDLLRRKLKEKVIGQKEIADFYSQHSDQMRSISLARIVTPNRDALLEIKQRIERGEREFYAEVMAHSIEKSSRIAGGYFGVFQSGMLPPHIEKQLFATSEGDLAGPFEQDGYWTLYRVLSQKALHRDRMTEDEIAQKLFSDWLSQEILRARP